MTRRRLFIALALLAAAGAFAVLVAWSGVFRIAASSGHWPITDWFLHFAMRHSVDTWSSGIEVPDDLDDPALVLKGAGHYESGCAPCHGTPGGRPSLVARQMTPRPPYLPPEIPGWEPEELFWIVKHGVKFTGMPAWPARTRDDEVWAMVAFLRRLPDMTPDEYAGLAHGPVADGASDAAGRLRRLDDPIGPLLESCARCHGLEGRGRGTGAFPKLADQSEVYLAAALEAYAQGTRFSGVMQPIAAGLTREQMRALAAHFAEAEPGRPTPAPDPEAAARGQRIARIGVPDKGVPACVHCHGPKATPRNPHFPALAGQYADYLELQLELFRKGHRGGSPYAAIMNLVASRLTPEQIRDLAAYYAGLDEPGG